MQCQTCQDLLHRWQDAVQEYAEATRTMRGSVDDLEVVLDRASRLREACFRASAEMTAHMRSHGDGSGTALKPIS